MAKLTTAGENILKSKNFVTHTRIYVNDVLQIDTSTGEVLAPVVNYQINRSRKLGAAKMGLTISNVDGKYSFHRNADPVFSYGNRIKVQEGLTVGNKVEWFTRFTGVIVQQVATNFGGMPSLQVNALDRMKLLLDYLPDEILYRPRMVKVAGEVLTPVENSFQHYRGSKANLPWADIPYPIFYKNGTKIKENYEIDLINGEIYFGEQMWTPSWQQAWRQADNIYVTSSPVPGNALIRRSFRLVRYGRNGVVAGENFDYVELASDVDVTYVGNTIYFSKDPFSDLEAGSDWTYLDKKLMVTVTTPNMVTSDYWYYDDNTNMAEDVIRDIALRAGFKEEQIDLMPTGVSLRTLRFTNLTVKNGFEMLQKVKQQLSPNYIITCDVEGKLRGYYASQMAVADYELELMKKIEAPISEESLYTGVVAHGITLNPNDLAKTAYAENLLWSQKIGEKTTVQSSGFKLVNVGLGSGSEIALENMFGVPTTKTVTTSIGDIAFSGDMWATINKSVDDQVTWHWTQKNNDKPPEFPIDLMKITLKEPKRLEEISILVGDYNKGTIEQIISVQVSENGSDWFYVDRESRGLRGASSQWVSIKGGELENREIGFLKIRLENGYNWTESNTTSKSGGWALNPKMSVKTDNYYHWFAAIKEIQIWEKKELEVTSTLGNYLGRGDGREQYFYFPNTPLVPGSERIYVEGMQMPVEAYAVNPDNGQVKFYIPPTGVITSDYSVKTKVQALTQSEYAPRYLSNVTVINPPGTLAFVGGDIQPGSAQHRLLKKIGMKKISLPIDNYLNTVPDVKNRGEEMLQEITRLEETLTIDAVYRPDVDICQTIHVFDPTLGISGHYFVEEITEGKQGYKPMLNLRVSKYSL